MSAAESTPPVTRPRRLRPGDTVALVAPAGPVEPDKLTTATTTLESWSLRVDVLGVPSTSHPRFDYLAGTDELRAREFTRAWMDPAVAAVIAARGGYGSQRMIDLVDWGKLRSAPPKVFAGSSDMTPLHQAINDFLGIPTLFSPMPATSYFDDTAADHLHRTLVSPEVSDTFGGSGTAPLRSGRAHGITVGGNLSLLAANVGSAQHHPSQPAVALLEDTDEDPYRLDRMLTQLLRSGWFTGVRGIALGSWTNCGAPDQVRELMLDRLGPLGVPMAWNMNFGHHPGSLTLPLGVGAHLDADAGILSRTEPLLS